MLPYWPKIRCDTGIRKYRFGIRWSKRTDAYPRMKPNGLYCRVDGRWWGLCWSPWNGVIGGMRGYGSRVYIPFRNFVAGCLQSVIIDICRPVHRSDDVIAYVVCGSNNAKKPETYRKLGMTDEHYDHLRMARDPDTKPQSCTFRPFLPPLVIYGQEMFMSCTGICKVTLPVRYLNGASIAAICSSTFISLNMIPCPDGSAGRLDEFSYTWLVFVLFAFMLIPWPIFLALSWHLFRKVGSSRLFGLFSGWQVFFMIAPFGDRKCGT